MVGAGRPEATHTIVPRDAMSRKMATVRSEMVLSGRRRVPSMSTATIRSGGVAASVAGAAVAASSSVRMAAMAMERGESVVVLTVVTVLLLPMLSCLLLIVSPPF